MSKTYEISYSIKLYANYFITAESYSDAIKKAERMLDSDEFREEHLIPDFDEPLQWGDAIGDAKVEILDDDCEDEPSLSEEDVRHWTSE